MQKLILISIYMLAFCTHSFAQSEASIKDQFRHDTAKVEQLFLDMQEVDYTTYGMHMANITALEGYDKLLNKYYKLLMQSLDDEGRKTLKETQRNWIKFRDSEYELNSYIADALGGTMWGVLAGAKRTDITKQRVIELYNYLTFSDFQ